MSAPAVQLLASSEIARAAELWRGLERALGAEAPLVRGWDWTAAWLTAYGDAVPHRFAIGRRGDAVVGAALVVGGRSTSRADLGLRLLYVGTSGEPEGEGVFGEYDGVLAAPGEREAFAAALVERLLAERGWDELRIDGFELADARAVAAAAPRLELGEVASPWTDLAAIRAADGDVVAALGKGPRGRIRRSLRALGEVVGEWAETPQAARAVFDELVGLHQARWRAAGEPGAFASPRALAFHHELIEALAPSGRVVLYRASADGETVGCLYGMVDRGRLLFYQGGLADAADSKVKPGLVAHALCMQECLERGIDAYDFLAGDARYKRELATAETQVAWGRLTRPTARSLMSATLRRIGARPRPVTPFDA
jgi:CelD/BcsL family acetyltransferase involved in cellulose biosynthesis